MSAQSASQPHPVTATAQRKWLWRGLAIAVLAALGVGVWWYFRTPMPEPPVVDLSQADPEVAQVIQRATAEVKAAPRDANAWGKLGMLLLAHDFDTESRAAFRTAAELNPSDYRWPYLEGLTRVLYEPEAGLDTLRRAAELSPADRPEPRLRVAELLIERGELDSASKLASDTLTSGMSTRAELILARVAAARGDWQGVLDHSAKCTTDPRCARAAALLRGQALAARGETASAEAEFRTASTLQEPPAWPDPVVAEVESQRVGTTAMLAHAAELLDRGRAREAMMMLDRVVAKAPNSSEPTLRLGQALIRLGDASTARRMLETHAIRFPTSVEGWFNLGVARFQMDDVKGAAEAFRQAIQLKPDHALAHFNLGHCYRKLGDKPAAKAAFEEALRCRPDHQPSREALDNLASGKD
jgi:cytochrome c-type biogenesis protein CcmH/NrfG